MLFVVLGWFVLGCVIGLPSYALEVIASATGDAYTEKKKRFGEKSKWGHRHPVVLGLLAISGILGALGYLVAFWPALLMLSGSGAFLIETLSYCAGWFLVKFLLKKHFDKNGKKKDGTQQ